MQTLLIAEKYPLMSESINHRLSRLSYIDTIGICQSEKELKTYIRQRIPDILILDINIIKNDPFSFCSDLMDENTALKILLFADFADLQLLEKYFKIGIRGYLPRQAQATQLLKAIETIANNQIFLADFFRNQLVELKLGLQRGYSNQLTEREKEVLKLIIEEYTTREIAEILYISDRTAETHRVHLIQKLGVRNTAGLVREGVLKGLYI